MSAIVHVGMSVREANQRDVLHRRAVAAGASLAFLQHGEPSLVAELDRLADAGVDTIRLEPVVLGGRSPARSWLRRVAGHWLRVSDRRATILVGDSEVTGREAGLTSPAWQEVPSHARHLLVCRGPRCQAQGADATAAAVDDALGELGLGDDDVLVTQTGCLFPCNNAPVLVVHPDDTWFGRVDADEARRIVVEHVVGGQDPGDHVLPRR